MGLNDTPSSERVHIAFFGKRNAGKSSLVNAVTGQELSVVSDVKGTTTDPVLKAMELLPAGPVVIIDTPGYDDEGALGEMRVRKTEQILEKTDLAVLVIDGTDGISSEDSSLKDIFVKKNIPFITAFTKSDLTESSSEPDEAADGYTAVTVSIHDKDSITKLKNIIAEKVSEQRQNDKKIIGDLLSPSDVVVLVIPVDAAAPKGRLILPQQMVLREVLDAKAIPVSTQTETYEETLSVLNKKPKLVITDSQAFAEVSIKTPDDLTLTSFSILMANYKGVLSQAVHGLKAIKKLHDGDKVLISEGCTHHRQCGDIGTVKLPALIRKFTGVSPDFHFTSGREFPEDLSGYTLVIHCGGCMLNEREMQSRSRRAAEQNIPFTNYGTAISYMNGILTRTLSLFPNLCDLIRDK